MRFLENEVLNFRGSLDSKQKMCEIQLSQILTVLLHHPCLTWMRVSDSASSWATDDGSEPRSSHLGAPGSCKNGGPRNLPNTVMRPKTLPQTLSGRLRAI